RDTHRSLAFSRTGAGRAVGRSVDRGHCVRRLALRGKYFLRVSVSVPDVDGRRLPDTVADGQRGRRMHRLGRGIRSVPLDDAARDVAGWGRVWRILWRRIVWLRIGAEPAGGKSPSGGNPERGGTATRHRRAA